MYYYEYTVANMLIRIVIDNGKKMYYYEYTVENTLIGTDNGKCITMNRQWKIY